MLNRSAPEGKELKYANRERERRFLLAASPSGSGVRTVSITDRYLTGTRIRLRRSTEVTGSGENVVYQLTQKLLDPDGGPGLATTMYLTAEEHRAFARLPAALLNKTRLSVPPLGVDLFEGALDGLILAETEFPSDEAIADFTPPPTVVAEVTNDQRFTGGQLAIATRSDIATALSQYGITMPDQRPRARGQRPEARGQRPEMTEPQRQPPRGDQVVEPLEPCVASASTGDWSGTSCVSLRRSDASTTVRYGDRSAGRSASRLA